jgi:DNA-binding NarL/FixJ family response regulator
VKRRPVSVHVGSPRPLQGIKKTRVLIADDYPLARDAIKSLLAMAAHVEVVREVSDGREAVQAAVDVRPDVVLINASMPGMRNFDVVRAMRRKGMRAGIVVIARHSTPEDEFLALESGADGYLSRTAGSGELLDALRSVRARRRSTHPAGRTLDGSADGSDGLRLLERLSRREHEVLRLVVEGKPSAEIARMLHLSPKTVETYRSRLMRKLGVSGLPALVKLALQHGLTTFN